ncbi:hypothetical protein D1AOALGA4SA_2922 [Olavius algarvensis Delta 1 endosymbiont]|nr:hypothetical protein D1AOALGA4SA_2922 [Olavius algarvensis Delta 1 endosymbiont]
MHKRAKKRWLEEYVLFLKWLWVVFLSESSALGAGSRPPQADRPDQASLSSGAKNEGCRDVARGEVGPKFVIIHKSFGSARQHITIAFERSEKQRLPRRSQLHIPVISTG